MPAQETSSRSEIFVGRTREFAQLRDALEEVCDGRGRLFLVHGEPGIGKTTLAEQVARLAQQRAIRALWGRCWEGDGAPAYWPWIQVIRALVGSLDADGRRRLLESERALPTVETIAQIVPELFSSRPVRPGQPLTPRAPQSQFALLDAVATLLREAARLSPIMIILDDLHDADIATLTMLRFVARELRSAAIFVVGTYREVEMQSSPELRWQIGDLSREARSLPLSGLSSAEVATFFKTVIGEPADAALVGRVHEASGGNPLFVDGIVRGLISERDQGRDITVYKSFRAPHDVREAIARRLAKLSEPTRAVLEVAGAIGNEFDAAICMRVKEIPPEQVDSQLDEAARDGILVALGQGRYRFAHALIRGVIHNAISTVERARSHRRIAEEIEKLYAGNIETHLQELAYHYLEAGPSGNTGKAIEYAIRAGDSARRVFAHEVAFSQWSTGLKLIEEFGGDQRACAAICQRLGDILGGRGGYARAIEHLERALRIYQEFGDEQWATVVRLDLANLFAMPGLASMQDLPRATEHLSRAKAVLNEGPENAGLWSLYWLISRVAIASSLVVEARAAAIRSIEIAERIGDTDAWAISAALLARILLQTGRISDALKLLAQVRSRVDALELQQQVWLSPDRRTTTAIAFGAVGSAGLCLQQLWDPCGAQGWWGPELARSRLQSSQRKVLLRQLEDVYLMQGNLRAARSLLEQHPHPSAAGLLAFYEGEWERAESILEQGFERSRNRVAASDMLTYEHALARVRWIRGEPARAAMLLEEVLASWSNEEPHCQVEMVVRPELALIYLRDGRPNDALAHVERCRKLSGAEDWRGLAGHLARAEAAVLATAGKLDEANARFECAVATFRKFVLPWEEAEALFIWGRALLDAREISSADRKFDSALEIYRRVGAGQAWIDRTLAEKTCATGADKTKLSAAENVFRSEGDLWTVSYGDKTSRLRHLKGLSYIAFLLNRPGERVHAIDLVQAVEGGTDETGYGATAPPQGFGVARGLGDAGEALDAQALEEYRQRQSELRAELESAQRDNDPGRVGAARHELEAISDAIAGALGLGGRVRKKFSHAERARSLVTKHIRSAIDLIRRNDVALATHFDRCIQTGTHCAYLPGGTDKVPWQF
jgi:tetratricopeptide (TPR) repeat protein